MECLLTYHIKLCSDHMHKTLRHFTICNTGSETSAIHAKQTYVDNTTSNYESEYLVCFTREGGVRFTIANRYPLLVGSETCSVR